MLRSTLAAFALAAALFTTSLSAQTFLQEDFSTAVGLVPPAGWSSVSGIFTTTSTTPTPAPFRFDNPGARAFNAPFAAPFAIADPDNAPSLSGVYDSILRGPAFNAAGTTLLNLTYDTSFRALQTAGDYAQTEVWDGSMWNVVANFTTNQGYLNPTAADVSAQMLDITAAAGGSTAAQLRFNYRYGFDWWWAIDNVKIEQPSPIDMAMVSIDSPVNNPSACLPPTGLLTVTVTIENQGSLSVLNGSLIQMDYQVNGGPATTEFLLLGADLLPGAQIQYTFAAQANLPAPGPNTLTATVLLAGDADPIDDSLTQNYAAGGGMGLATMPFFEDFESHATVVNSTNVPAGWINDPTDGTGTYPDWRNEQGTTGSLVGPTVDHTTGTALGWYMYIEDSVGTDLSAINLITPCMDFQTATAPSLNFWHHSNVVPGSTDDNLLEIDVITYPGGAVTMSVGTFPANGVGSDWTNHTVDLTPFAGTIAQIVFRGRNDNGSSFQDDVAIDDISIFEPMPTPGQAPRTGLAAFDINSAKNINNANVASGLGGPYYANVTQGGIFGLGFDGSPNQPIAVVYGALNPVSATYPGGIGQFDVGGPGVDPQGIPLNLGVLVNAIAWASAPAGFPVDAVFFCSAGGTLNVNFGFPNFGIPAGSVLTTFQAAIAAPAAPFVYLSNAIEVTVN